ncbi:MAG: DUF5606 domain-containing protein [Bacteroidia bacterium]|nr:DUF5606 domain-containing protein [Bacteroidia bacterium]
MDLSGIISIAGMSGIYKVVAQTKNGLIVESLIEKKRMPTYATQRVSALDDISIFTSGDDISLKDVFQKIMDKLSNAPAPDHKSTDDELKTFFTSVLPEYDKERVYVSDIRKVVMWYNILQKNDLLKKEEPASDDSEKTKINIGSDEKTKSYTKPVIKDTISRQNKSAAPKKTQTTRKTGAA